MRISLALTTLVAALASSVYAKPAPRAPVPIEEYFKIRRVGSRSGVLLSFSHDEKLVAYLSDEGGRADVWVQPVAGGAATQITHVRGFIQGLAFSPASDQLAYTTADAAKVVVMGGSYGGYMALAAAAFAPREFAANVDYFGVSDLKTLVESFPPYWASEAEFIYKKFGDPKNPADAKYQHDRSPIHYVDKIVRPLLVVQGDRDARVRRISRIASSRRWRSAGCRCTTSCSPTRDTASPRTRTCWRPIARPTASSIATCSATPPSR
jgi:dipeptidyl aminopeptidase/acylaminoacyl peptidase